MRAHLTKTLPLACAFLLPMVPPAHAGDLRRVERSQLLRVLPPFESQTAGAELENVAPEPRLAPLPYAGPVAVQMRSKPPSEVRGALAALSVACAGWSRPMPQPEDRGAPFAPTPEDQACDVVTQPGRVFGTAMWFGAALGTVVTILGLVGFCVLRMVLVQLWAWRPQPRSMPQQWS